MHRDGLTTLVAAYRRAGRTDRQLLLRTGRTRIRAFLPPQESRPDIQADDPRFVRAFRGGSRPEHSPR